MQTRSDPRIEKKLDNMIQTVKTLALGYFFTDEKPTPLSRKKLRAWFLDAPTQMNPHLPFAQSIPGRNQGRGDGIIETHNLPQAAGFRRIARRFKVIGRNGSRAIAKLVQFLSDLAERKSRRKSRSESGQQSRPLVQRANRRVRSFCRPRRVGETSCLGPSQTQTDRTRQSQRRELERTQGIETVPFSTSRRYSNAAAIAEKT